MTDDAYFQAYKWGLSNTLTTNHVWDGFMILSLLDDAVSRGHLLLVPHTGAQSDCFKAAMEEHSQWIVLQEQPDAVRHACDLCMQIFHMPDGTFRVSFKFGSLDSTSDQISGKCQAIVGDGLSMGRPCCGVFRCKEPLLNNRHRFCTEH